MSRAKSPVFGVCLLCFLMFSACGSSPAPTSGNSGSSGNSGASPAEAQALAQAALNRMDGGQAPAQGTRQTTPATQQGAPSEQQGAVNTSTGARPAWVDSVDSAYSRAQYVAAVGNASDRTMAEKNALANLVAIFGQTIQADQKITNTYQEAVKNGVTSGWSDNVAMENTIKTSASMDTLVGAEIRGVWFDSRSTYYAVAVMEKAKAAPIYRDLIIANQNMIKNLVTMSQAEKNTLEGYSRYQFAAAVADMNTSYANLLKLIDAVPPEGIVNGNQYRLEAQEITKAIPVGVIVRNDKSGRVQGAFSKSLTDLGFRRGANNSRYVLRVDVSVSPVNLPNNQNKFARMELSADLTDTSYNSVLLPWNFNTREGHNTVEEAENRTYSAAEREINAKYKDILSNYLSQLLPKK